MRRPSARSRLEERGEVGERYGQRRRVGDQPRRGRRTAGGRDARAPAAQDACDGLLDAGHGRRRERSAGRHAPGRGVEADRREDVRRHGPPDDVVQAGAQLARPAAPHRVEVDERAVLVEDDGLDTGQVDRRRSAATASPPRPPARRSRSGPRPAGRTRQASRRESSVTGVPASGHRKVRVVERVDARSTFRRRSSVRTRTTDAQEADILDGRREPVASVASPCTVEGDHLGPDRDRHELAGIARDLGRRRDVRTCQRQPPVAGVDDRGPGRH